ncbi:hypothetical protein [Methylogaea oryzae]|uniref:Uncharacterized protein n=1 Tax=Methylogaea oryzae TaxID=1295382 RepID=A0A8D4VR60_9GAMM|nr:hypothetical protein [Methylogaea oryzae]BBL72543.1 hypothetical protein MoryE10_31490 [Methylogaea oryzae]
MSTKELLIFVVALFFVWSIGVAEGVVIHILYQIGGTYTARIDELEKKIEQCKAASQASALTPMPAPAPAPAPAQTNSGSAIDSVSGQ